jgi:hypothetical protein
MMFIFGKSHLELSLKMDKRGVDGLLGITIKKQPLERMIQATQLSPPWRAAPSSDGRDKSITNASRMEGQTSSRGLALENKAF